MVCKLKNYLTPCRLTNFCLLILLFIPVFSAQEYNRLVYIMLLIAAAFNSWQIIRETKQDSFGSTKHNRKC